VIIVWPELFNRFFRKETSAFAFYPFIVLRREELKNNTQLIRHEKIHFKQQLELLIVPFYLIYFLEFCGHFIRLRDMDKAYRAISFEKEAYAFDRDTNYVKNRKWFGMWRITKSTV